MKEFGVSSRSLRHHAMHVRREWQVTRIKLKLRAFFTMGLTVKPFRTLLSGFKRFRLHTQQYLISLRQFEAWPVQKPS